MTKIVCIADQHGHIDFNVPKCDILLIAGDITPTWSHDLVFQRSWFETNFKEWLENQPVEHIVFVAGNHDFLFETGYGYENLPGVTYLQDDFITVEGFKIWGTPWSLPFGPWAFMKPDSELKDFYAQIPDDTDIVISHNPIYGFGDKTADGYNAGSKELRVKIKAVQPQLFVCGHIHEGYGHFKYNDILIKNASLRNEYYEITNAPIIVEL